MNRVKSMSIIWVVLAVVITLYYLVLRQHVFKVEETRGEVVVAIILLVGIVGSLLLALVIRVVTIFTHRSSNVVPSLLWGTLFAGMLLTLMVVLSQMTAYTPEIQGVRPIAELKKIDINGRTEWLSIRGEDRTKPVMLFLAGGPGGSHLATARHYFKSLESSYVVVIWEQPGASKSLGAIDPADITLDTYLDDGAEVVNYLRNEFKQSKIFLMGESWGSALGLMMVEQHPEFYYSFIGTGQMVDFLETEIIDYQMALDDARKNGNDGLVAKLEEQGPPPYSSGVALKTIAYLSPLNGIMARTGQLNSAPVSTLDGYLGVEYGLLDKLNYFWGLFRTLDVFYSKLYSVDLRERCLSLDVPIYVFHGRYDFNAPASLVEDYMQRLKAPAKSLVYFEHSGHNPWQTENELFIQRARAVFEETMKE